MRQEEQRPKAFKSSIWYIGLMVSGVCLFAGLMFTNWCAIGICWQLYPHQHLLKGEDVDIIEEPLSETEAAAQSCSCHPNKVPTKVEGYSNATIEIRNEETLETITVPEEFHTESHWHEGAQF